jgi:hypothetical protein
MPGRGGARRGSHLKKTESPIVSTAIAIETMKV